jgi:predicted negative regulator of RcsB-dependent stress response
MNPPEASIVHSDHFKQKRNTVICIIVLAAVSAIAWVAWNRYYSSPATPKERFTEVQKQTIIDSIAAEKPEKPIPETAKAKVIRQMVEAQTQSKTPVRTEAEKQAVIDSLSKQ